MRYFKTLLVLFLMGSSQISNAYEGLWPFNRLPKSCVDLLKNNHGVEPSDAWIRKLMRASVRLSVGGSGSFVSSHGLVLTNYHVAEELIGAISTPEKDYMAEGFSSKTFADELKVPGLEIDQLVDIQDFSDEVLAVEKPGMSEAEKRKTREAKISEIRDREKKKTGYETEMVNLYNGAKYDLYFYKRYTDVRLVFAPEYQAYVMGGDADNFEYPRFSLDMVLLRVYENDKPVETPDYFKWSQTGPKEGELLIVSGNPGSTSRLSTSAELEYDRDIALPETLKKIGRIETFLLEYAKRGPEQERHSKTTLLSVQNGRKAYLGQLNGLQDPSYVQLKKDREAHLLSEARKKPELVSLVSSWAQIEQLQRVKEKNRRLYGMFSGHSGSGFFTDYFGIARHLVRIADEMQKPSSERLSEYSDSQIESVRYLLLSESPIYDEFEEAKLAMSLEYMDKTVLPADPERALVDQVFQGRTPAQTAHELIKNTKLKDIQERKRYLDQGKTAIDQSTDPMILLAKLVDQTSRDQRKFYEDHIEAVEVTLHPKIKQVTYAVEGADTYPDATFSPRLSFGVMKGYVAKDGTQYPAYTELGQTFAHSQAHRSTGAYQMPQSWFDHQAEFDHRTPYNFVFTNDSIGGNSGSPVVNVNLDLVGLLFDGNLPSLVWDYFYTDEEGRSVGVHSAGMLEALRKIYHVDHIVDELLEKQQSP
ncbi:MAG: S46 family peptidase [Bacteriovoracia bacterium]